MINFDQDDYGNYYDDVTKSDPVLLGVVAALATGSALLLTDSSRSRLFLATVAVATGFIVGAFARWLAKRKFALPMIVDRDGAAMQRFKATRQRALRDSGVGDGVIRK